MDIINQNYNKMGAAMNILDSIKINSDFIDQFIPYVRNECCLLINPFHKNELSALLKDKSYATYEPTTGVISINGVEILFSENIPHFQVNLIRVININKCR